MKTKSPLAYDLLVALYCVGMCVCIIIFGEIRYRYSMVVSAVWIIHVQSRGRGLYYPYSTDYYAICVINHKRVAAGPAHTHNRLVGVVNLATALSSNLTYSYYMNEQSITSGGCYNKNTALLAGTV